MTNFDALKQLPVESFSSLIFRIVSNDCKSKEELEMLLRKEVPVELEEEWEKIFQEALQEESQHLQK